MDFNLRRNMLIEGIEDAVKRIKTLAGDIEVTKEKITDFAKEGISIIYMNKEGEYSFTEKADSAYVWFDTGYIAEHYNRPIFCSLVRHGDIYTGHYIGTAKYLAYQILKHFGTNEQVIKTNNIKFEEAYKKLEICHYNERESFNGFRNALSKEIMAKVAEINEEVKEEVKEEKPAITENTKKESEKEFISKESILADVTQDVWDRLLINNWCSIDGLDNYIKVCGARIQELVEKKDDKYYVLNNLGSAIINTGLLNQFGQDILVLYRYHKKAESYRAYRIIESKSNYLTEGFTKEQAQKDLEPISFTNEVFDAESIDDFDITYRNLTHILQDRKDRLPDLSEQQLADKLHRELVIGLALAKRDSHYVKPYYSAKQSNISWLLPFHIERPLTEEPELVMVLQKRESFYEVKTVFSYDDGIKDKITSLSLYGNMW